MPLLTDFDHALLLANARVRASDDGADLRPVVKLFTPDANATWLLSELDPDDRDRAFGLCDLGLGEPELGYVLISALEALRGPTGLPVERDAYFSADRPLSAYARAARAAGRIVS